MEGEMAMKEVTPKELQKLNSKSFKNTQKIFRRRLREIAADGHTHAEYQPKDYKCGEQIKPWLENLGFKVKEIGPSWCKITWPEGEDIIEKLRKETFDIWSRPIPAKVTWGVRLERFEEEREWIYLATQHEYVCSGCGKHAKCVSDYCPNCGKKMKVEKGENR
jgi:hypothetical protein